jgi:hypothetical protein
MSMKLKKKVKELTGDDATQASQIQALQTAIGDDDTPASIKGRLYALEHPANGDG